MIFLKILNSSELVAAKLGGLLERMTPEALDESTVEGLIIEKMIKNLKEEGIQGEISSLKGVDVDEEQLLIKKDFKIRNRQCF